MTSCPELSSCPAISLFFPKVSQYFEGVERISQGTFSSVYRAKLKKTGQVVALKHILPFSHPKRICREILCLSSFGDNPNVLKLFTCARDRDSVLLVIPYIEYAQFSTFFREISLQEILCYMRGLFNALKSIHEQGIVHRDVKPGNYLYNVKTRTGVLIDFGLASTSHGKNSFISSFEKEKCRYGSMYNGNQLINIIIGPFNPRTSASACGHNEYEVCEVCTKWGNFYAPRGGTSGYRAPEVLLRSLEQTEALDLWSAGVILLSFMSGRCPFFTGKNDIQHLSQVMYVLGGEAVQEAALTLGRKITYCFKTADKSLPWLCYDLMRAYERTTTTWKRPSPNESKIYNLLMACLDPNPRTRITARQALSHDAFRCV